MKFAFMTFSTPELTLAEVFDAAKRYGYEGVEPRTDREHKHGVEVAATADERLAIKSQAAEAGVELACLATSINYTTPENKDQAIQDTHERIDLAADCGIATMRVFGGLVRPPVRRDQAFDLLISSLKAVGDHAGERGVHVCVETHDHWTNPDHMRRVMEEVNHPNIAVNWDIMHPVRIAGYSIDEAFETLKPWIRHLHVHDGEMGWGGAMKPIGEGAIDHRRALELMKSIDYDGYVSGEWIKFDAWDVHLPREIASLKKIRAELA